MRNWPLLRYRAFLSGIIPRRGDRLNGARRPIRGFTLIEVMIVVAIVAILAAIAYPSYIAQVRKGHRAAAQSYLMDLAQREQQYMLDARSYTGNPAALGYLATPGEVSPWYNVTIA